MESKVNTTFRVSRRTKNSPETNGKSENVVVFFVLYSYTSIFDISFTSLFQFAQNPEPTGFRK